MKTLRAAKQPTKMNNLNLPTKIILVLLLYTVLREVLPVEISLYRGTSYHSSSTTSSASASAHEIGPNGDQFCQPIASLGEVRITLEGESFVFTEHPGPPANYIDVEVYKSDNLNLSGASYLPLFKPIDFRKHISYTWGSNLCYNNKSYTFSSQEHTTVSGTYTIYGLCSRNYAERLIRHSLSKKTNQQVAYEIYQAISEKLTNE